MTRTRYLINWKFADSTSGCDFLGKFVDCHCEDTVLVARADLGHVRA